MNSLSSKQFLFRRFLTSAATEAPKYTQGQYTGEGEGGKRIREYFYFIDHQGMLFLDDSRMKNFTSCFKEVKFLRFFFSRLKENTTGNYEQEFPYLSLCGNERNYIRCDDLPVVFTHLIKTQETYTFNWGWAGDSFKVPFQPEKLYMDVGNGRVYHPGNKEKSSINVGLIRDRVAIEISNGFRFDNEEGEPKHFQWRGETIKLNNQDVKELIFKKRKQPKL